MQIDNRPLTDRVVRLVLVANNLLRAIGDKDCKRVTRDDLYELEMAGGNLIKETERTSAAVLTLLKAADKLPEEE